MWRLITADKFPCTVSLPANFDISTKSLELTRLHYKFFVPVGGEYLVYLQRTMRVNGPHRRVKRLCNFVQQNCICKKMLGVPIAHCKLFRPGDSLLGYLRSIEWLRGTRAFMKCKVIYSIFFPYRYAVRPRPPPLIFRPLTLSLAI